MRFGSTGESFPNKDLYVIPNFYPMRYKGILIISILGNSNKISNNKQWGTRDFYVENSHTNCRDKKPRD